jgi:hypothetical protein
MEMGGRNARNDRIFGQQKEKTKEDRMNHQTVMEKNLRSRAES